MPLLTARLMIAIHCAFENVGGEVSNVVHAIGARVVVISPAPGGCRSDRRIAARAMRAMPQPPRGFNQRDFFAFLTGFFAFLILRAFRLCLTRLNAVIRTFDFSVGVDGRSETTIVAEKTSSPWLSRDRKSVV